MLQPREIAPFVIRSIATMPDQNTYFVLEGSEGYRNLLPFNPYQNYGFEVGQEILCQVVKINCNGKLFLEPRNPYYAKDEYFPFLVAKSIKCHDCPGVQFHVIRDRLGNEYNIATRGMVSLGTTSLICKVKQIYKGKLVLEPEHGPVEMVTWPPPGTEIGLKVLDLEAMANSIPYYILGNNSYHFVFAKAQQYAEYHWNINDVVNCHVFGKQNSREVIVEPEHPRYKLDETYEFVLVSTEERSDLLLGPKRFLLVKGPEDKTYEVLINGMILPELANGITIQCRVRKYRNGNPVLSLAQSFN